MKVIGKEKLKAVHLESTPISSSSRKDREFSDYDYKKVGEPVLLLIFAEDSCTGKRTISIETICEDQTG